MFLKKHNGCWITALEIKLLKGKKICNFHRKMEQLERFYPENIEIKRLIIKGRNKIKVRYNERKRTDKI
jgi:hypothetical protein